MVMRFSCVCIDYPHNKCSLEWGVLLVLLAGVFLFFFLFTCVDTTTSRHEQQTFSITRRYYRKFRNFTIKVLLITVIDLFASLAPVCSPFFHFFFSEKLRRNPKIIRNICRAISPEPYKSYLLKY